MGLLNPQLQATAKRPETRVGIHGNKRMHPRPCGVRIPAQPPAGCVSPIWEPPCRTVARTGGSFRREHPQQALCFISAGVWGAGAGTEAATEPGVCAVRQDWGHPHVCTLKMPAMERVRLEVLETRRNSEKPRPKARIPPRKRLPRTRRSSPVSWKRKIFSDVDKWRPESKGRQWEATCWCPQGVGDPAWDGHSPPWPHSLQP